MSYSSEIYDLIGVGFGPSNLALAIAMKEANENINCCFIEKQEEFVWHGNMMFNDARMQISFLKDLVSLRNPQSNYSFINYLHQKDRLSDFINLKTFYPSRVEFNDYMAWAAGDFNNKVQYGEEIIAIEPVPDGSDEIEMLKVISRNKSGEKVRFTRNIVIGIGGIARYPEVFKAHRDNPAIFHSSGYLKKVNEQKNLNRIAVVGAGQSAIEIFLELHGHSQNTHVDLITRSHALKQSDDSPFVNEIFNPSYTDYIFGKESNNRKGILDEFSLTNYAAGDLDLLVNIYEVLYQQKVSGDIRHRFMRRHEIKSVESTEAGINLSLKSYDSGEKQKLRYDTVILATGYIRNQHLNLLESIKPYIESFDAQRNYALKTDAGFSPKIFLQGSCENTHGLSDTLLSILPVRSAEIHHSLSTNLREQKREQNQAAV